MTRGATLGATGLTVGEQEDGIASSTGMEGGSAEDRMGWLLEATAPKRASSDADPLRVPKAKDRRVGNGAPRGLNSVVKGKKRGGRGNGHRARNHPVHNRNLSRYRMEKGALILGTKRGGGRQESWRDVRTGIKWAQVGSERKRNSHQTSGVQGED
ncbi:hypothetical protein NPIL_73831 [Nephila pilipes]|uniref:Uncharacterized protein n=1 Tax=Nephila pilipes TaxID=299642 RepID=A0A8X6TEQ0_NEPPI|nr:hypothetical protein NPIL_73831 [Nephila pilipes]